MKWSDSTGLTLEIRNNLNTSEVKVLAFIFNKSRLFDRKTEINQPGEIYWQSLLKESHKTRKFRKNYANAFITAFRNAKTGQPLTILCCPYHRQQFEVLKNKINKTTNDWLPKLFEVTWASAPSIHACRTPSYDYQKNKCLVSRIMPLDNFVDHYVQERRSNSLIQLFSSRLSPLLSRSTRLKNKSSGKLSVWHGRIGTRPYKSSHLSASCNSLKQFLTPTDYIDKNYNRNDSPHILLSNLGVPFKANRYYIEIQFESSSCCFRFRDTNKLNVAVPTIADAAGYWAFRPDRDKANHHNYTRNLLDGTRGNPEVISQAIDIDNIYDVVVWGSSTSTSWDKIGSPYAI